MKLLVDMNLSPSWIERLAQHGFEAVHWSAIGAATAGDDEILSWARVNGFVLLTHDHEAIAGPFGGTREPQHHPWKSETRDRHPEQRAVHRPVGVESTAVCEEPRYR